MEREVSKKLLAVSVVFLFVLPVIVASAFVPSETKTLFTSNNLDVSYATGTTQQRCTFKAQGVTWVFFSDGMYMRYASSVDGENFYVSDEKLGVAYRGARWSVATNGTHVAYARYTMYSHPNYLFIRVGKLSVEGRILWLMGEQLIKEAEDFGDAVIAFDSDGNLWVATEVSKRMKVYFSRGFTYEIEMKLLVIKLILDGEWKISEERVLDSIRDNARKWYYAPLPMIVSLNKGGVYVAWSSRARFVRGQRYDNLSLIHI